MRQIEFSSNKACPGSGHCAPNVPTIITNDIIVVVFLFIPIMRCGKCWNMKTLSLLELKLLAWQQQGPYVALEISTSFKFHNLAWQQLGSPVSDANKQKLLSLINKYKKDLEVRTLSDVEKSDLASCHKHIQKLYKLEEIKWRQKVK